MLRFYHAILRVILRGGRKPHGRAIPIWQTRQSSNCITWPGGNMENTASPAMLRRHKKWRRKSKKAAHGSLIVDPDKTFPKEASLICGTHG